MADKKKKYLKVEHSKQSLSGGIKYDAKRREERNTTIGWRVAPGHEDADWQSFNTNWHNTGFQRKTNDAVKRYLKKAKQ